MKKILFILVLLLSINISAWSWNHSADKDEMTGEKLSYASSSSISSTKKMDFPYSKTKSWIGVGCKDGKQWAYFGFTTKPNLNNTSTEDGYSTFTTRVKIDNEIINTKFTQDWGSKFLHISNYGGEINDEKFIEKIKKANLVILELQWHGNGSTFFKFPLKGSTKALNKMQNECGYTSLKLKIKKDKKLKTITAKKVCSWSNNAHKYGIDENGFDNFGEDRKGRHNSSYK